MLSPATPWAASCCSKKQMPTGKVKAKSPGPPWGCWGTGRTGEPHNATETLGLIFRVREHPATAHFKPTQGQRACPILLERAWGLDQFLPPQGGNVPRGTFAVFPLGPGHGQVPVFTALDTAPPKGIGRAAPVPPSGELGHGQGHKHLPTGNPRPESPRGHPSSMAQGERRVTHSVTHGQEHFLPQWVWSFRDKRFLQIMERE